MMVLIFSAMTLALVLGQWGPPRLATAAALVALALGIALFVYEIDDRKNGFAMPWLNVEHVGPAGPGRAA